MAFEVKVKDLWHFDVEGAFSSPSPKLSAWSVCIWRFTSVVAHRNRPVSTGKRAGSSYSWAARKTLLFHYYLTYTLTYTMIKTSFLCFFFSLFIFLSHNTS